MTRLLITCGNWFSEWVYHFYKKLDIQFNELYLKIKYALPWADEMTEKEKNLNDIDAVLASLRELEEERRQHFNEPRFALGTITGGIGVPEVTVRNWLTRGQIELSEGEQRIEGKHRRFSVKDAIRIAAAFQLSGIGAPVKYRSELAEKIAGYSEGLVTRIQGSLKNPVLLIFNDGEWKYQLVYDDGPLRIAEIEGLPPLVTVLNVQRLIEETLRPLGIEVMSGTSDELRAGTESKGA